MNPHLRQIFTELIASSQEQELYGGSRRDLELSALESKITVCVGVRRCGKSTLMQQQFQALAERGIPRENMLMLNFADERLANMGNEGWNELYEAYYSMYPQKRRKEKVYFCFDEIQTHPHWELFVERLRREENCEIYITGSSAAMLSREIHTALRGRSLSWELFPFSFGEYLERRGIPRSGYSTSRKLAVQNAWSTYREEGGFPEAYGIAPNWRIRLHQDYFDALLYRDVVERYNVSQPLVLKQLARRMLGSIGAQLSINKLSNDFRSSGISISKETIQQYIAWLEDAYFLFCIPACSASASERFRLMRKVYCIDHAMVKSLCGTFSELQGQMLENMVFLSLRRNTPEVYYYKTQAGHEVDFLAVHPSTHEKLLVQVCARMDAPETRQRELRAMTEAMAETGLNKSIIVTESETGEINTTQGNITLIAAPEYLSRQNAGFDY